MSLQAWTVVVVEDTYDDQRYISRVLEYYGAKVHVVGNGEDCLALLTKVEPTLIVTDLALPTIDGWQTLNAIRANAATAHIPVVALTAYHSNNVAQDARLAGFNGYFPKPVHPQAFLRDLQALMS